jgi:hypothetical protein
MTHPLKCIVAMWDKAVIVVKVSGVNGSQSI